MLIFQRVDGDINLYIEDNYDFSSFHTQTFFSTGSFNIFQAVFEKWDKSSNEGGDYWKCTIDVIKYFDNSSISFWINKIPMVRTECTPNMTTFAWKVCMYIYIYDQALKIYSLIIKFSLCEQQSWFEWHIATVMLNIVSWCVTMHDFTSFCKYLVSFFVEYSFTINIVLQNEEKCRLLVQFAFWMTNGTNKPCTNFVFEINLQKTNKALRGANN